MKAIFAPERFSASIKILLAEPKNTKRPATGDIIMGFVLIINV